MQWDKIIPLFSCHLIRDLVPSFLLYFMKMVLSFVLTGEVAYLLIIMMKLAINHYLICIMLHNLVKLAGAKATLLPKQLNSSFNEGPATFNDRQNTIYFTRNNNVQKKFRNIIDRKNKLGIYYSKQSREGDWSLPQAFQYNNAEYNVAHPSLSEDGNYLYFSSDMPGGFGGSDLYVCEK
ncbi:MAG: hypothetical protein MZV64_70190 [Ignavibacteriales bacterium]|nr:hypothetical protein [Ignavibacteriales bacterium]